LAAERLTFLLWGAPLPFIDVFCFLLLDHHQRTTTTATAGEHCGEICKLLCLHIAALPGFFFFFFASNFLCVCVALAALFIAVLPPTL